MKDASAVIELKKSLLLVAGDEKDEIEIYHNPLPHKKDKLPKKAAPRYIDVYKVSRFLSGKEIEEADIEAAAQLNNYLYWIGSHGRNAKGILKPKRHAFFALKAGNKKHPLALHWQGNYNHLLRDMLLERNWPIAKDHKQPIKKMINCLKKASKPHKKHDTKLAPKKKGINIEALAANPSTETLLIGLRNPLLNQHALIIELLNPKKIIKNIASAKFGRAWAVDLHGLGLRDMVYDAYRKHFLLIAGPTSKSKGKNIGKSTAFKLFSWRENQKPKLLQTLPSKKGHNPEAILAHSSAIQIFYDSGSRKSKKKHANNKKTNTKKASAKNLKPFIKSRWYPVTNG